MESKVRARALAVLSVSTFVLASTISGASGSVASESTQVPSIASAVKCMNLSDAEVKKFKGKKCPTGWVKTKRASWVKKRIKFLESVREMAPALDDFDDASVYGAGAQTCQILDAQGSVDDVIDLIKDAGVEPEVGASVIVAAVLNLCPGHRKNLEEWIEA